MELSIQKLSKAFNRKSVFRDLTFSIASGARFAISGHNGSGKSTLLKILSGGVLPSTGEVRFIYNGLDIEDDQVYRYVHFVAPYNTVIEEFNLIELFQMHRSLGMLGAHPNVDAWLGKMEYPFDPQKQIKTFSSGMKQRVKLGIALLDNRPLILLDEPCSNLDAAGKNWFFKTASALDRNQTLVIASNEMAEIEFCSDGVKVGI
jgi:ABC-type multidrug transport system ATPase subunit